jgi:hypothetical protein
MKDFFSLMGKAFAVVFGTTLALALVSVLLVLAARPVLRSWSRETPANLHVEKQPIATPRSFVPDCWDEKGRIISCDLPGPVLSVRGCTENGCAVYSGNKIVGSISRDEIIKGQWTPVNKNTK